MALPKLPLLLALLLPLLPSALNQQQQPGPHRQPHPLSRLFSSSSLDQTEHVQQQRFGRAPPPTLAPTPSPTPGSDDPSSPSAIGSLYNSWAPLPLTQQQPNGRLLSAQALAPWHSSALVVVGGLPVNFENGRDAAFYMDMWEYRQEQGVIEPVMGWTQLCTSLRCGQTLPSGRFGASLAALPGLLGYNGTLVLFGGNLYDFNHGLVPLGDTYAYVRELDSWQQLPNHGTPPSARALHANAVFTFTSPATGASLSFYCVWGGGVINYCPYSKALASGSEVYCLDQQGVWTRHVPTGEAPPNADRAAGFNYVFPVPGTESALPGSPSAFFWAAGGGFNDNVSQISLSSELVHLRVSLDPADSQSITFAWANLAPNPANRISPPPVSYPAFTVNRKNQGVLFGGTYYSGIIAFAPEASVGNPNVFIYTPSTNASMAGVWRYLGDSFIQRPSAAAFSALVPTDIGIFLYGGLYVYSQEPVLNVWTLVIGEEEVVWLELPVGIAPPQLENPLTAQVRDGILLLGGLTAEYSPLCTVYMYELVTGQWSEIQPYIEESHRAWPQTRFAPMGAALNDTHVLMMGGTAHPPRGGYLLFYDDVWVFDTGRNSWECWIPNSNATASTPRNPSLGPERAHTSMPTQAPTPAPVVGGVTTHLSPRLFSGTALLPVPTRFYVYGGCITIPSELDSLANFLDDMWYLEAAESAPHVWHEVPLPGYVSGSTNRPPPLCGAASGLLGDSPHTFGMYMYGGQTSAGIISDLWHFAFSSHTWHLLQPAHSPNGYLPGPRLFPSSVSLPGGKKFVMASGIVQLTQKGNNITNNCGQTSVVSVVADETFVYDASLDQWEDVELSATVFSLSDRVLMGLVYLDANSDLDKASGVVSVGGLDSGLVQPVSDNLLLGMQLSCNPGYSSANFLQQSCQPCDGEVVFTPNTINSVCETPSNTSRVPTWGVVVIVLAVVLVVCAVGTWVLLPYFRARAMEKHFHIFVSYRVATDSELAQALVQQLEGLGLQLPLRGGRSVRLRCFLDVKDLKLGDNWRDGFLDGLKRSCLFVPIVSEAGVAPIMGIDESAEKEDNVLLEYETALQLRKQGRIQILPLLVGRKRGPLACADFDFARFGPHLFPSCPSLTYSKASIRHTMTDLLSFQGIKVCQHVQGEDGALAPSLAETIGKALLDTAWGHPRRGDGEAADGGSGGLQFWRHWKGGAGEPVRSLDAAERYAEGGRVSRSNGAGELREPLLAWDGHDQGDGDGETPV